MQLKALGIWIKIRESMWFIPGLLVLAGLILAPIMVWVDTNFGPFVNEWVPGTFTGSAQAARVILGTIAGALATVVGIAFSITVVVLQLAAGQYSPRVITTFRRDRGQQVVLGSYLGTFIYALLVVREVRSPLEGLDAFIPGLSMLVALILSVMCLGMLVYFVHHTSEQLRVADISRRIHQDLMKIGDDLYPENLGEPYEEGRGDRELIEALQSSTATRCPVRAQRSGYVQQIDASRLGSLLDAPFEVAHVRVEIGEFVLERGTLVELHLEEGAIAHDTEDLDSILDKFRRCVTIGSRPTLAQNPGLATQQLVDIALRALSPGVNDPTTAEQVLAQLGDWIAKLAHRSFPTQVREVDGRVVVLPAPDFEDHVGEAFDQIRRVARTQVHVLHSMLDVFDKIRRTDPPEARRSVFREQIEAILRTATAEQIPDEVERENLIAHARFVLAEFGGEVDPEQVDWEASNTTRCYI